MVEDSLQVLHQTSKEATAKSFSIEEVTPNHSAQLVEVLKKLYDPNIEGAEFIYAAGERGKEKKARYLASPQDFEEYCQDQAESLLKYIARNQNVVFIVYDGDNPIGLKQFQKYSLAEEKLYLATLTVIDPHFRGQGLAGKIDDVVINQVIQKFKDQVKEIYLIAHVEGDNTSSISRLLKSGYTESALRQENDELHEHEFVKKIY